ncbi:flagellar biosynthesis/type III secretory pathway chaperone [Lederbergia galactosidilyticus]|uniref:flagellar protein FlgN n=1 Tax=Lederbergia galactosidilytica TaxID=217031 RepID=UPI001AE24B0E|nr:flagellar protein FlgN [Lederbergia galactosidilytica]MBP1913360.1 flagellar biosynthesis/type III secretory pathway chaperone [Lederbergia galactosidilytica]
MSSQTLIEAMETLLDLHQQLLAMTIEKTEVLQKNDIETLSKMIREEQKVLTAIQVAEQKREKASLLITNQKEATVSDILKELEDAQQERLSELQIALIQVLGELQEANALNQQLLQYSLQFVNMNLDLLAPEQELPNYTKEQGTTNPYSEQKRSMFDSQA